jgi:phosphoribosylformimino-5-aminoimidazole carboxamide ribotide isomerase
MTRLLDLGLSRLVIGTLAVNQPDWFRQMCRRFPQRLALGLDARQGIVATAGWLESGNVSALEVAGDLAAEPLAAIIYTDIETDGMLSGPNFEALSQLKRVVDVPVVASGGITTADDVGRLAALGLAGCIIGRALYEGSLSLSDALRRARVCQST